MMMKKDTNNNHNSNKITNKSNIDYFRKKFRSLTSDKRYEQLKSRVEKKKRIEVKSAEEDQHVTTAEHQYTSIH